MTILRLHHTQITIPPGAEERARRFYCHLLGLSEVEKPAPLRDRGGFWLRVGDAQVHVGAESGVDRSATKAHVAYEVDDLAGLRRRLDREGVQTQDGVPIAGYDRFEVRDPFGNRVEFIQPTG